MLALDCNFCGCGHHASVAVEQNGESGEREIKACFFT